MKNKKRLIELLNKLKIPENIQQEFSDGEILNVYNNIKEKTIKINLFLRNQISINAIDLFKEKIKKLLEVEDIELNIIYNSDLDEVDNRRINEVFKEFIDLMVKKITPEFQILKQRSVGYIEGHLLISCTSDREIKLLNDVIPHFENFLKMKLIKVIDIKLEKDITKNTLQNARKKLEEDSIKNNFIKVEKITIQTKDIDPKSITPIDNIEAEIPNILVQGKVFNKEHKVIYSKKTQKEYQIFEYKIYDGTNSILVKRFKSAKINKELYDSISKDSWIQVRGKVVFDKFISSYIIEPLTIFHVEVDDLRYDNAPVKRVELHTHTKMSTLDSVIDLNSVVNLASRFGMDAIGVTDHNNVQSFPKLMSLSKKYNIKAIYGMEADFISGVDNIGYNANLNKIKDTTFVVFDIETTGLSAVNDKIIELSAVKFKYGEIQYFEEFLEIVNIGEKLSAFTTKLTNITDDMISEGSEISHILEKFDKFSSGSVLVAHNAKFDKSFMEENYLKYLDKDFNFPVLDTLWIARKYYSEFKSHTLKILTSKLKVKLESHHRAIDDSIATAHIFVKMLEENFLEDLTISDLSNVKNDNYWKNIIPQPLTLLVKNQTGLKNLYKLSSEINTTYFHKSPRLLKDTLNKYREGLLVGSGLENSSFFDKVLNSSFESALEDSKMYDYLEIPPISNISYLIEKNSLKSDDVLKRTLVKIIEIGKLTNKKVVAVSNAHNLNKEDYIFREIFTSSTPMHRLNNKNIINYPSMYFRSTEDMFAEWEWLKEYFNESTINDIIIKNPHLINEEIEKVIPLKSGLFTPKLENIDVNKKITELTYEGAKELYGNDIDEIIIKRIEKELTSIISHGFAVIYLVFRDLVLKSNEDGYLVGSRGSVGSSLVAFLIGITEVNALQPHYICLNCKHLEFFIDGSVKSGWDLEDKICPKCSQKMKNDGQDIPFETFLGFKGDKVPDIDLNFSGDYQPIAHQQLKDTFGEDKVYRAGTISTVASKTAFGYVKAYEKSKEVVYNNAEIDRLVSSTEGVKRTTGQHPGGIIIVPQDMEIYDFSPIQFPADDITNSWNTTHFDYRSIHDNLLKADILGHDDPTILKMLYDLTGIDPKSVPLNDKNVMSLFSSTDILGVTPQQIKSNVGTYAIPEFGTSFVRKMLEIVDADQFSSLVQISGLSHGTDVWLGNAETLIKEKEEITINDVIGCRDDIMVYLIYAGLEPSDAFNIMEKVRKGFGVSEEAEKMMRSNKVPEWYIDSCKKIKYMFPKAHASAYVLMAIRIAWYKVNKPIEFYSTFFSVRPDTFDLDIMILGEKDISRRIDEINKDSNSTPKERTLVTSLEVSLEMCARGFYFTDVDLIKSHNRYFIITEDKKGLIPPFRALDGLGTSVANEIFVMRKKLFEDSLNVLEVEQDKLSLLNMLFEKTKMNKNHYTRLKQTLDLELEE